MRYSIETGVLEMDISHKDGWTFRYYMQVNIEGQFVEKNFKPELVSMKSPLGFMGYIVTKPTPVMVKRWEWYEYEEFQGTFNKRALIQPYLDHNLEYDKASSEAESQAKQEKKLASDAARTAAITRDPAMLAIIDSVIAANPKAIAEFKSGKDKALNALIGQVLGGAKKQQIAAEAFDVNKLLREQLHKG